MKNKKISLVIPMYNEENVVNMLHRRLKDILIKIEEYNHEIIYINDGSKDLTLELLESIALKDNTVKIISFTRNFRQQNAIIAGLKYVSGNAVVIMDADLQDPPELIPKMLKLWEEGNKVIYGKRKIRKGVKLLSAKRIVGMGWI